MWTFLVNILFLDVQMSILIEKFISTKFGQHLSQHLSQHFSQHFSQHLLPLLSSTVVVDRERMQGAHKISIISSYMSPIGLLFVGVFFLQSKVFIGEV